jgi:hypothetical protein
MTALYVIGIDGGLLKLGIAKDPKRRLSALRAASGLDLRLLHSRELADDAWKVEGHAHRLLNPNHVRGEWFSITAENAIAAIDAATECVANGEVVKRSVGRKKQWTERIQLPLAEGTLARIDALLRDDEVRLDMIREAIEREIKRRARQSKDD